MSQRPLEIIDRAALEISASAAGRAPSASPELYASAVQAAIFNMMASSAFGAVHEDICLAQINHIHNVISDHADAWLAQGNPSLRSSVLRIFRALDQPNSSGTSGTGKAQGRHYRTQEWVVLDILDACRQARQGAMLALNDQIERAIGDSYKTGDHQSATFINSLLSPTLAARARFVIEQTGFFTAQNGSVVLTFDRDADRISLRDWVMPNGDRRLIHEESHMVPLTPFVDAMAENCRRIGAQSPLPDTDEETLRRHATAIDECLGRIQHGIEPIAPPFIEKMAGAARARLNLKAISGRDVDAFRLYYE